MNFLLETAHHGGLVLDAAGLLGLGLIALAAVRLSRRHRTWSHSLLGWGAVILFLARVYVLVAPQVITRELLMKIGHIPTSLLNAAPVLLLTGGFAAVVWGLWGHEKRLHGR
jgi:hypothetical protein